MLDKIIGNEKIIRAINELSTLMYEKNFYLFTLFFIFFSYLILTKIVFNATNFKISAFNLNSVNLPISKVSAFILFNIVTILLLVFLFPIQVPFVDDWLFLNNKFFNGSFYKSLLAPEGNHSYFLYKIFNYINFYFFNFTQGFFSYLSIALITLTSYFFYQSHLIKRLKTNEKIIFFAILFAPKQIIDFTQSVNLIWLIYLFFVALFIYSLNFRKMNLISPFTILGSPLSIGSGITVPFYILLSNFLLGHRARNYLHVIISALSIFLILNIFPKFDEYSIVPSVSLYNEFITHFSIINLLGLFVVVANIYSPPHFYFSFFPLLIGLIQIGFIVYIEKLTFYNLKIFFLKNPLLILGFSGSILIILFRSFPDFLASRYSTISIIFQLGFLIWLCNLKNMSLIKNLFLKISLFFYLFSWFLPYEGLHTHFSKYVRSSSVELCYKKAIDTDLNFEECNNNSYQILFYGGSWFDKEKFLETIDFLYANNLNFFFHIKDK